MNFYAVGFKGDWIELRVADRRPKKYVTTLKRRYKAVPNRWFEPAPQQEYYNLNMVVVAVKGGIPIGSLKSATFNIVVGRKRALMPGSVVKLTREIVGELAERDKVIKDGLARITAKNPDLQNC